MVGLFGGGVGGDGCLRCWFDQVDVHDPEITAACSYDICLWVSGIGVNVHFVSSSESIWYFQVLSITSLAKPCRSRLLMPQNPKYVNGTWAIRFSLLYSLRQDLMRSLLS